jgi:hypothetical protein
MAKSFRKTLLALSIIALTTFITTGRAAATPSDPVAALPPSDAIAIIEAQRILAEALPRAVANDATKMARVNAEIARLKSLTGIDMRRVERAAAGLRAAQPPTGGLKGDTIVIAQGETSAEMIAAAGRTAASGKHRTENHGGKTIHVFTLNERINLFGVMNMHVGELAVTALAPDLLAFGSLAGVKAAIDAGGRAEKANAEVIALARRIPNALVGLGGNVPPGLLQNLDLGNEEIAESIASIKQFYGAAGMTPSGFNLQLFIRAGGPEQAKRLNNTLNALRSFSNLIKDDGIRKAVDNLKITTEGPEVQIKTELAQTDIAAILKG